jgi:nucleoside-diphosphate-sugar epimerase
MKALVLGASGATGSLLVRQLIDRKIDVRMVVRDSAIIPADISENKSVEIIKGNIHESDAARIERLISGCEYCASCLGHNINLKGLFGHPRKLVVRTIEKITRAMESLAPGGKFILMSTTAYTNTQQGEANSFGERIVFSVLELLLPPHKDNMLAANHLVHGIGSGTRVEWVAVRPDSLFDEKTVSGYDIYPSKTRSPIFHPGKTSRINVGHFMAELFVNDGLWQEWKYKTPVIYNKL